MTSVTETLNILIHLQAFPRGNNIFHNGEEWTIWRPQYRSQIKWLYMFGFWNNNVIKDP